MKYESFMRLNRWWTYRLYFLKCSVLILRIRHHFQYTAKQHLFLLLQRAHLCLSASYRIELFIQQKWWCVWLCVPLAQHSTNKSDFLYWLLYAFIRIVHICVCMYHKGLRVRASLIAQFKSCIIRMFFKRFKPHQPPDQPCVVGLCSP